MFKRNFKKTILTTLVVCLGFLSPIGFNTKVNAEGPSFVNTFDKDNGTIEFGNQFLTRSFSVVDGKVKTTQLNNKIAQKVLFPQDGTQDFVINTKQNNAESQQITPAKGLIPQVTTEGDTKWQAYSDSEDKNEGDKGGSAQFIFDGDASSYYHSDYHSEGTPEALKYPHYIYIDLKTPITMQSFSYHKRLHNDQPTQGGHIGKYVVRSFDTLENCKDNNNEGKLVAEGTFADNVSNKVEYANFNEEITVQFLRLEIHSSYNPNSNNQNAKEVASIGELNFYTDKTIFPEPSVEVINSNDLIMDGDPIFTQNGNDSTLRINFQPIKARGVDYTISEIFTMKSEDKFMRKHLEISVPQEQAVNAVIDYIDLENMKFAADDANPSVQPGDMKANFWTLKDQPANPDMSNQPGKFLELGQPYYVGAMYWGCEFPETENKIRNIDGVMTGFIRYHYGKNLSLVSENSDGQFNNYNNYNGANGIPGKMVTWDAVVGAARSTEYQVVQSDFYDYIETIAVPTPFRQQFNSWYDNMKDITNENILESFAAVEKGFTQYGVAPLDSYVVDDGWQTAGSLWRFNGKFPNELYDSSQQVHQMGSNFGLWLGPRGGYGETVGPLVDYLVKNGKGSRNERAGDANISDGRYLDGLINEVFIDYQNKFDINYWKLDGMLWAPSQQEGNYHVVGNELYTVSETYERWTDMYERMIDNRTKAGKDLWINMTSYANPSPWHLQWVNSLWMQNTGDTGFDGYDAGTKTHKWGANDQQSMLTYRDADYYDFFNDNQWQLPNKYFYNHDPVYAKTAHKVNPSRHEQISYTTDGLREHLYMLGTRGTAFWEYYYSPSMFDEGKWQVNAEAANWIEDNFHILQKSKMFGGNPENGDVYGFSCWNGNEGIVSIRNPKNEVQTIDLTYDRLLGVTEGISNLYGKVIIGDLKHQTNEVLNYSDVRHYELKPMEVLIIQYGQQDTSAPAIENVKIEGNTVKVKFNETVRNDFTKEQFNITEEGGIRRSTSYKVVDAILEEDLKTVKLTLDKELTDLKKYTVEASNINDTVGNGFTGKYIEEYFENNAVTSIVNRKLDGKVIDKGSEYSIKGNEDFSIIANIATDSTNATIAEQEGSFKLSINEEGYLVFDFNGLSTTSKYAETVVTKDGPVTTEKGKVNDGNPHNIVAVKEVNGMIKLYVDEKVVGSNYDENKVNPELSKGNVKFAEGLVGYAKLISLSNIGVSYDEVAKYVPEYRNVALSKNGATISAWNTKTDKEAVENPSRPLSQAIDGVINRDVNYGELTDTESGKRESRYYQIELKESYNIDKIKMTRFFTDNRKYGPTVIALYEEDDTKYENPTLVFSTDKDDVHGLNNKLPNDFKFEEFYEETENGKTIENIKENSTKTIRVYVNGNLNGGTSDHLVELEAYGNIPGKEMPHRIDYSELELLVSKHDGLDKKEYTKDSYNLYVKEVKDAISEAKELLANKLENNDEKIDRLVSTIKNALAKLEKRADVTAASAALDAAKELNKKDYTKDSWKTFEKAKSALQAAVKDNSNTNQTQLDELLNNFNLAKDGLVRKDEPTTPTPTVKPESTPNVDAEAPKAPAYDDGGPFTTDECGSVYDRWGNLMWKSPTCKPQVSGDYNLVNTKVK